MPSEYHASPREAYHAGNFRAAEQGWREVVAREPTDWVARHNLGLALAQQGHWPEAAAQWTSAFLLNPRDGSVRWHLALGYERADYTPPGFGEFALASGPHLIARLASPAEWQWLLAGAGFLFACRAAAPPGPRLSDRIQRLDSACGPGGHRAGVRCHPRRGDIALSLRRNDRPARGDRVASGLAAVNSHRSRYPAENILPPGRLARNCGQGVPRLGAAGLRQRSDRLGPPAGHRLALPVAGPGPGFSLRCSVGARSGPDARSGPTSFSIVGSALVAGPVSSLSAVGSARGAARTQGPALHLSPL